MLRVVQAQAPHGSDLLRRQRTQEQADVGDVVGHIVLAEDVAGDDPGLLCLPDVRDAPGQDGVAVVGAAVLCQEADQALPVMSAEFGVSPA